MILGIQQIAVAEGMLLGQKMGLKPDVLAGVLNTSTGAYWNCHTANKTAIHRSTVVNMTD